MKNRRVCAQAAESPEMAEIAFIKATMTGKGVFVWLFQIFIIVRNAEM